MDLGIEGKTALVMGASRGIGRAIAAVLAQEGVKVAMASRSRERLEEAAKEIEGETAVFEADTSDLDWLAALPDEVASKLGPVEILVTNTGGPPLGAALDHEHDEWLDAYGSLLLAPRTLAPAAPPGGARGGGAAGGAGGEGGRDGEGGRARGRGADPPPHALQCEPDGRNRA